MADQNLTRRGFLSVTGATGLAGYTLLATRANATATNSNSKLRVGFIGVGGRGFDTHVKTVSKIALDRDDIELAAVCDVYSVHRDQAVDWIKAAHRQTPASYVDHREMLERERLDAVCIATPDHWHAKQAIEAMQQGVHVYCEKPMVKQVEEAIDLMRVWRETNTVMQVGVQSTSLPLWDVMHDQICSGQLGKVLMFQTEYFRNSDIGQWRYYPLTQQMSPKTIDWRRFLGVDDGLSEDRPFDRAVYAQWRRFWPFGAGMFTDLFVHRVTTMLKATGLRFPGRVTGGGGIYLEYDGRQVPDVATVVADFNEGVQGLVTATMCAEETPIRQLIRGHHGSFELGNGAEFDEFTFVPERPQATHISPQVVPFQPEVIKPDVRKPTDVVRAHFENWLSAIQAGKPEMCNNTPELGAAAIVMVNLGARSYREGKVYFFDDESMEVSEADGSWAAKWEERSRRRGKPSHIAGWNAGDTGSLLREPPYQNLEGPWVNGVDPAG